MNKWDKKKKLTYTKQDEFMDYLKLVIWILLAGVYCYFMVWG